MTLAAILCALYIGIGVPITVVMFLFEVTPNNFFNRDIWKKNRLKPGDKVFYKRKKEKVLITVEKNWKLLKKVTPVEDLKYIDYSIDYNNLEVLSKKEQKMYKVLYENKVL
jgi:hypothetical protein